MTVAVFRYVNTADNGLTVVTAVALRSVNTVDIDMSVEVVSELESVNTTDYAPIAVSAVVILSVTTTGCEPIVASVTQWAIYVTSSQVAFAVPSTPTRVRARSIISAAPSILSAGTLSSSSSPG
jgi:hypothetical protein